MVWCNVRSTLSFSVNILYIFNINNEIVWYFGYCLILEDKSDTNKIFYDACAISTLSFRVKISDKIVWW